MRIIVTISFPIKICILHYDGHLCVSLNSKVLEKRKGTDVAEKKIRKQ